MNFYQRMGILPLKKRVNRDKCSFTTKQRMFGVFAIDEILRYQWTRFVGSRTLCHPVRWWFFCTEIIYSKLNWLRYLPELASQANNGEITLKGEGRPDGIFSAKVYLSDDKFGQDVQNYFIQQLFQVQTAGIWTTSTNPAVKMRGYLEVRANLPAKVTRPDNWGSE